MLKRFDEDARRTIVLAQEEAQRLRHTWLGTEHLLLGLLRQDQGVAADVLGDTGIAEARERVEGHVGLGRPPRRCSRPDLAMGALHIPAPAAVEGLG